MTPFPATRLYLLRHARSGWAEPGGRDHDRALDERGCDEARHLGETLRKRGVTFDSVVSSTAVRARQTVEGLGQGLCASAPRFVDDLYAMGPDAYWSAVRSFEGSGNLLIVGHNPTIETFAVMLDLDEPEALVAGFPTCGLAIFETSSALRTVSPGQWRFLEAIWP